MAGSIPPWARGGAPALVALAVLVGSAPGPAQGAAERGAAPTRSWVVDRVRVENLGPEGFLGVAGVGDYRGALELVRAGGGVAVVNDVGFEDYLRGIAEVPASWPMEVQRAQVIAARTYALHEMARRDGPPGSEVGAHICSTQACQVYVGLAKERSPGAERWVAAVESTRNQVLVKKGAPILAMYSSGQPLPPLAPPRPPAPAPARPPPPSPTPPPAPAPP
ncbi:MAG: SpoIID/LytB domain-containing protein, partial [Actinomycetota bacterium]|nr:SpoIID/LytB domain-containing protein [Actinomycetota bacterium]